MQNLSIASSSLTRFAALAILSALVLTLAACPPAPLPPKVPVPEYEDPPAPSWLPEAGAEAAADES